MYQWVVVMSLMFGSLAGGIQVNWNDRNRQVVSIVKFVDTDKALTSEMIQLVTGNATEACIETKTFASEPRSGAVIILYEIKSISAKVHIAFYYAIFRIRMDTLVLENVVIMDQNAKPFGSIKSIAFEITIMDYDVFDTLVNYLKPTGKDAIPAVPQPHSQSELDKLQESELHQESDTEDGNSHQLAEPKLGDEKKNGQLMKQLVDADSKPVKSTTQLSIFVSKLHLQIQFRIELKNCRRNRISQ